MPSWVVSEDFLSPRVLVRDARRDDVPSIVALYRTDEFTRKHHGARDSNVESGYYTTLDAIERDARNRLLVAERDGVVAGSFQFTLVPDMSPDGLEIAVIENVIVDAALRGRGVGTAMMRWAIDEARRHRCRRVTLTSNVARKDAHRFYERLGFEPTHVGMKLTL